MKRVLASPTSYSRPSLHFHSAPFRHSRLPTSRKTLTFCHRDGCCCSCCRQLTGIYCDWRRRCWWKLSLDPMSCHNQTIISVNRVVAWWSCWKWRNSSTRADDSARLRHCFPFPCYSLWSSQCRPRCFHRSLCYRLQSRLLFVLQTLLYWRSICDCLSNISMSLAAHQLVA